MNIFYLSSEPSECAKFHADKHVIKMILEYSQLLSTAHRVLDHDCLSTEMDNILYKLTHKNHPSAIWVRQSKENYLWLYSLLCELCREYTYRYGKIHKCESIGLVKALGQFPNNLDNRFGWTEPTPAMPKEYIDNNSSIISYRNYYINGKQHLASWSGKVNSRNKPEWYGEIDANISYA